MPTDPAYRTYISTGHLTHIDDHSDDNPFYDTALLRVLLQPEYNHSNFAVELSFGLENNIGGFVRLDTKTYQELYYALDPSINTPLEKTFKTTGLAIRPDLPEPDHIPLIDTDSLDTISLTLKKQFIPHIGKSGVIITLGPPAHSSAILELTPSQRFDLANFLDECSVTPFNQRPDSTLLINSNADTALVPTGKLHSSHFDPHTEFTQNTS